LIFWCALTLIKRQREYIHSKEIREATELSNQIVGSIARLSVPSVSASTPVTEIASIMTKQNIGAVIVTRDFEVLGIVTERDIIERVSLGKRDLYGLVAQDIMTSPVITIHYDRTIQDALKIMKDNNIRRLIVVKGKSILGLVTERRLLLASFAGHTKKETTSHS
jgi:CBS domain-containing protein